MHDVQPRTLAWLARRVERAVNEAELTLPEYRVLCVIAEDSAGSSHLAGRLAVSKPRITALADRLAAQGYLERRHPPDDRRRVEHHLTDAGRVALERADAAASASIERILAELEPAEVALVGDALGLLARALVSSRARRLDQQAATS